MSLVTQEKIIAAKAKYGNVYVLEVDPADTIVLQDAQNNTAGIENAEGEEFKAKKGTFYALLQKPSKRTIGFSMTHRDPIQMGNAILTNTIVELDNEQVCDPEITENEDINIAAALQVTEFVNIGVAKLKKVLDDCPRIKFDEELDFIRQSSAWIRYYFKVDPYSLSDHDFAILTRESEYLMELLKPIKKDK